MKVRIRMRMVHAKGRGFSLYLFTFKVFPDTYSRNKQFKRKETPFFMPLISENIGFPAQAG